MTATSWKTGQSDAWTDPSAWSTGTVPGSTDDVTIGVAPVIAGVPYTVALLGNASVHSITQSQAACELAISNGTLSVAGLFSLAGTLALDGATLQGGTYASTAGTVLLDGYSTIANVAWDGVLDLVGVNPGYSYNAVQLQNDSFSGTGGSGPGTIVLGERVQATLGANASLQAVAVTLDNAASLAQASGTLTLGAQTTVSASSSGTLGSIGGAIVDQGSIGASGAGATLTVTAAGFSGSGTVSASNGASVLLAADTAFAAGLLSVGVGSYLRVETGDTAGLLGSGYQVQGGTLSVDASLATSQLGAFHVSSGTLAISGALQNTGAVLQPGAAGNPANLELQGGTITGGTIVNTGAFSVGAPPSSYPAYATQGLLSGVTVRGPLGVSNADLALSNGLVLTGTTGSGTGTITIGNLGTLSVLDNETLNTTIDIGTTGQYSNTGFLYGLGTLTLGANNVVSAYGLGGQLSSGSPTGLIVNLGTIDSGVSGGSIELYGLANAGLIAASNGGRLLIQNVSNSGTISDASGIMSIGGELLNTGVISVSGASGTCDASTYETGLVNEGLFSVSSGATANLGDYGSEWTNAGTFSVDHAELSLGGSFTTAQIGSLRASQSGTLALTGTLVQSGALSLGAGGAVSTLLVQNAGVVQGGTLTDAGGGLRLQGGALSDVTIDGVLSLAADDTYGVIENGVTLTDQSGTGTGSIAVTGAGSSLLFDDGTLDQVEVALGSSTGATLASNNGETLTLGLGTTVDQSGLRAVLGVAGGTLFNDGSVVASQAGGTLSLAGSIHNSGTIAVSNGETLALALDGLTNAGVIGVTDGAVLVEQATLAQLTKLQLVASTVAVSGTLVAAGGTLAVGAGGLTQLLRVGGDVQGGAIHDAAGGVQFVGNAILDGVTYQGTMDVNQPLGRLTILDGLTLEGLAGSTPGSLALTGAGSTLVWDSAQALDHATLSIGSNGTSYGGHVIPPPSLVAAQSVQTGTAVLLGSRLHVVQAGLYADIGSSYGTFSSAATLTANVAHGQFLLQGESFANTGTIGVSAGDTVLIDSVGFANAGLMVVGVGSAVDLDLYNYFAQGSLAAQSFINTGTLTMAGGMLMELTDNGAFPNVPVLNAHGGHIAGAGVVASQVDNSGIIEARGGVLNLVQAISGTGALQVDSGAMLVLGGVGTGQTVSFSGTGGLLGLQPAYFLGTIGGFASGDTIDLFNTSAHSAAFSGDSIAVALSNGGTLRLATTSALTGSLTVAAGAHGDELIRFAAGAGAPALAHAAVSSGSASFARQADLSVPIGQGVSLSHPSHAA